MSTQDAPQGTPPEPTRGPQVPPPGAAPLSPPTPQLIQPGSVPAAPAPAPKEGLKHDLAGLRDTVESVIIALILAFTFRAFVVEAFVIPTGSMAPTLDGAHFRVLCTQCGYRYDQNANLNQQYRQIWVNDPRTGKAYLKPVLVDFQKQPGAGRGELTDSTLIPTNYYRTCPNCGYQIGATELPELVTKRSVDDDRDSTDAYFPWTSNGDRILVQKFIYHLQEPQRWDVIVFKEPMAGKDNYIKRLIGLPGETVEIVSGNVFINGQIARKPPHVQAAMWQLVYDNDHFPKDAGQTRKRHSLKGYEIGEWTWFSPWSGDVVSTAKEGPEKPTGRWVIGPIISFEPQSPQSVGRLAFTTGNSYPFYLYNVVGYNDEIDPQGRPTPNDSHLVGDLHLEVTWMPQTIDKASLSLSLGIPSNRFKATLDATGTPRLLHWNPSRQIYESVSPRISKPIEPLQSQRAYRLAFTNADHRLELWVNGTLVMQYDEPWTVDMAKAQLQQQRENPEEPEVAIETTQSSLFSHLKLMRDVYYTQVNFYGGSGTGTAGNPITLRQDEFFALGDNSSASLDSRLWNHVDSSLSDLQTRPGVIPRRFMLGKAFFVYWPAGYRPSSSVNVPLVPDAGRMRSIR